MMDKGNPVMRCTMRRRMMLNMSTDDVRWMEKYNFNAQFAANVDQANQIAQPRLTELTRLVKR